MILHSTIYKTDNKDLLYSTGNSTQYSVMVYMGKEPKKEWVYLYILLITFCTPETNTNYKINYTPIKFLKNEKWLFCVPFLRSMISHIFEPPETKQCLVHNTLLIRKKIFGRIECFFVMIFLPSALLLVGLFHSTLVGIYQWFKQDKVLLPCKSRSSSRLYW